VWGDLVLPWLSALDGKELDFSLAAYVVLVLLALVLVARSIQQAKRKSVPIGTVSGRVSALSKDPTRLSVLIPELPPGGNIVTGWMDLRIGDQRAFMKAVAGIENGTRVRAAGIPGDRFQILALHCIDTEAGWTVPEPRRPFGPVALGFYLLCGAVTLPVVIGIFVFRAVTRKYRVVMEWKNGLAKARRLTQG
jgi:hypothetical protein